MTTAIRFIPSTNTHLRRPTRLIQDWDFEATQLLSDGEREVTVTNFNGHMALMLEDGPVLISREQARTFFDFD